jgi:hypothetical protein
MVKQQPPLQCLAQGGCQWRADSGTPRGPSCRQLSPCRGYMRVVGRAAGTALSRVGSDAGIRLIAPSACERFFSPRPNGRRRPWFAPLRRQGAFAGRAFGSRRMPDARERRVTRPRDLRASGRRAARDRFSPRVWRGCWNGGRGHSRRGALASAACSTFAGGLRSTPARRAFDRPMAIACFVDRAPCLPWRMGGASPRG